MKGAIDRVERRIDTLHAEISELRAESQRSDLDIQGRVLDLATVRADAKRAGGDAGKKWAVIGAGIGLLTGMLQKCDHFPQFVLEQRPRGVVIESSHE